MAYNGHKMQSNGVPSWEELRLDATKLTKMQRECYRGVHDMLDDDIAELDRKLSLLSSNNQSPSQSNNNNMNQDNNYYDNQRPIQEHKAYKVGNNSKKHAEQQQQQLPKMDDVDEFKLYEEIQEQTIPMTVFEKPKSILVKREEPSKPHIEPTQRPSARDNQYMTWRYNIDHYEHLKPPPMPLSYYLQLNRPELVREADRRVSYLKKKAERRKLLASERTINALDQIRISSRQSNGSVNTRSQRPSSTRSSIPRSISRDSFNPNCPVKYNFSEYEMKRLTARIYNRLPEVKKQRNQEVTKHLKVQNYKNKLEYGRKLLVNRRRGIINYPLKVNYDESSTMSSREESLTNSLDQSNDGIRFESYY